MLICGQDVKLNIILILLAKRNCCYRSCTFLLDLRLNIGMSEAIKQRCASGVTFFAKFQMGECLEIFAVSAEAYIR